METRETRFKSLYEIWDRRWRGSEKEERLTRLGRLMFKAKEKALTGLLPRIPAGSLIEVGCGLGHIMMIYRKAGRPCIGIDVSPAAITVCRNKGLEVTLRAVEEVDETYDLVSSDGMLEHFLNFEPMAQHLMRISRRHVLLIQPNHGSFWGKTLPYLSELIRGDENVLEYNYRIEDFIDTFERGGFRIVENIPVFADVFRVLLFAREKPADGNQLAGG